MGSGARIVDNTCGIERRIVGHVVGEMEGDDEVCGLAPATTLSLLCALSEMDGRRWWGRHLERNVLELQYRHVCPAAASAKERDKIYRRVLSYKWLGGRIV